MRAKPPSAEVSRSWEVLRLALASGLSLGLSLGFLDLIVGILNHPPPAFRSPVALLPALAISVLAFFLGSFPILLLAALAPGGDSECGRGPLVISMSSGLGVMLALAVYYGLTRFELNFTKTRLLGLVVCLAMAVGAAHYDPVRRAWTAASAPWGIRAALLALPAILGVALLFVWIGEYRTAFFPENKGTLAWVGFSLVSLPLAVGCARLSRRIRVERWLLGGMLLLTGLPAALFLTGGMRLQPAPSARKGGHAIRRILLLSVDTLREDAVSALSSKAAPTPSLDALAKDSVVFTRAYSPAPWTLPSFASVMTGLAPSVHQVKSPTRRIPDSLDTLAEKLQEAGYLTSAIGHQPWLRPQQGLAQGFSSFDVSPRDELGSSLGSRLLARLFPAQLKPTLTTPEITDFAIAWLRRHAGDDFFLWVHYFKPHGPYDPPGEYRPRDSPPEGMGYSFGGAPEIRAGTLFIPPGKRGWVRRLYEGELRMVDDNVGRLSGELRRLGIYDDTLIVFLSDHGEEFWEHDLFEHGHSVYEELIRVPLFFKLPGARAGMRSDARVSIGSVYPTLLDLCQVRTHPEWLSYPSLSGLLKGESFEGGPISSGSPLHYEDREAVVFDRYKAIHTLHTDRMWMFDLEVDPAERRDLAVTMPEKADKARKILEGLHQSSERLRKHYGIQGGSAADLSPESLEQLRSLGYIR
ncbi:MAG TPA: sulfatase [Candidatus Polarisedimenticolia bacterium]|nr:sulfatase [Candidatus Polarisedimenticolia bacterium]